MNETIVCCAIRDGETVISMPCPARHGDIIAAVFKYGGVIPVFDQGFLTSKGRYVGRAEAKQIALLAKQILPNRPWEGSSDLFSEDLW